MSHRFVPRANTGRVGNRRQPLVSRLLDQPDGGMTYASAGGGIGGFGGLFALDTSKYTSPVLVASADGVGTKLEVARQVGRYDSVGIDLVAMLVDDLVCVGAEPLFLLDYVAVGTVDPKQLEVIVAGVARGCRLAN